jgi:hypothetical protein
MSTSPSTISIGMPAAIGDDELARDRSTLTSIDGAKPESSAASALSTPL